MAQEITRRGFLKKGAMVVGGVAAATVGMEVVTPMILSERPEFDENTSLWASAQPPRNEPLDKDIAVDAVVIGGGYTGLSAAYHLARRFPDRRIVLLEARGIGHGGSGRNGAMILPQMNNEYMRIYHAPQSHKRMYDVTVANMRAIQAFLKEQGADCDLELKGGVLVIVGRDQVKEYREYCAKAQSMGIPVEFWDRERTRQMLGTDVYHASVYEPNAGDVHPMKLAAAYKKAAEAAGVKIYEDSPVLNVQEGEAISLWVGEQRHRVTAKALFLATNGYTCKLGYLKDTIVPAHVLMAATSPLDEAVFDAIGWKSRLSFSDTRTVLFHLGTTRDNRIMIGAGNVEYFFNNGVIYKGDLRHGAALLRKELLRIYPKLDRVRFERVWSGVIAATLDQNQTVGVTGKHRNIYYGMGYCGHGVNLAFLFGRIMADLYAGEAGQWADLPFVKNHPLPCPPEPLRWVGVKGTIAYYKMGDVHLLTSPS